MDIFFLFLSENICCGYSLEAPHRGASDEYPQHMFFFCAEVIKSVFFDTPFLYGQHIRKVFHDLP